MQVNRCDIAAGSRIETASARCPVWRILSAIVFVSAVASMACMSEKLQETPSITFTKIPPAAQGGREKVDTISRRVRNAQPKQQIVIYAHGGQWWGQSWPVTSDRDGDR
jgi:acetyl esterase/lipase